MAARRQRPPRPRRTSSRPWIGRLRKPPRSAPPSSATSATRWCRSRALARSPLAAVVFFEVLGFNVTRSPTRSSIMPAARSKRSAPTDRVRASLAAHAPYSVAPLVFRAIRKADRSRSVRAVQRASVGIGRGGRVHPHRRRPVAPAAGGGRGLELRVDRAGRQPGAVSRRQRVSRARACSPCTACR